MHHALRVLDWVEYTERNMRARAAYFGDPMPDTPMLRAAGSLPGDGRTWELRRDHYRGNKWEPVMGPDLKET